MKIMKMMLLNEMASYERSGLIEKETTENVNKMEIKFNFPQFFRFSTTVLHIMSSIMGVCIYVCMFLATVVGGGRPFLHIVKARNRASHMLRISFIVCAVLVWLVVICFTILFGKYEDDTCVYFLYMSDNKRNVAKFKNRCL